MPSYSKNEVVLVRYPFSDVPASKIRPAVLVGAQHSSADLFVVPLSSRIAGLQSGEFILSDWAVAGLRVPTTVRRGLYTVRQNLVIKTVGRLSNNDARQLEGSLRDWLGF
jgi:mRNA interferase MazF